MDSPSQAGGSVVRKSPCRYGRGCTHINDPSHLERFRHPPKQELNADEIRRNYMCNECGRGYDSLSELRFHLQKKTAWSNESLVGSRISCLVDCKEWHEGLVTHFHRSGKHCVEFRAVSEKRWFHMLKLAFYIIEPMADHERNEYKDSESGSQETNDEVQKEWTYFEDISFDYAFTQSVLFKIYGGVVQETGHKTRGHISLTEYDRYIARSQKGSLLYGELLPRGVNKALDSFHLDASNAQTLFDMGMGTGKVAIQAFLQYRNLAYVYGVELSVGRYLVAEAAVLHMVKLLGKDSFHMDVIHGEQITVTELVNGSSEKGRALRLQCGNMMDVKDIRKADIIMMETDIPAHLQFDMCTLLQQEMHESARILSYHDLYKIWPLPSYPFKQLEINCSLADRFPTSWSVQRGHHFFLFKKSSRQNSRNPFQRHMSRGSPSRNDGNLIINKSPSWSGIGNQPITTEGYNSPDEASSSVSVSCHPSFSEKEYRESEAYATAFPSIPNQNMYSNAVVYHYNKEIPQINSRNRNGSSRVEENDGSGHGCSTFLLFFARLFSCRINSSLGHQHKSDQRRSRHNSGTPQHLYDTVASPSLPTCNPPNQCQNEDILMPPHNISQTPTKTVGTHVKILLSNSPRSVHVEQSKKEKDIESPVN